MSSPGGGYNTEAPSIKRLMMETREMARRHSFEFHAAPVAENLFDWHFTMRGAPDTEFESGIYHGRIILPPTYPHAPPHIIFLTPNGRFEVGTKICLSASAHHPEDWNPSWKISTLLVALRAFMPTPGLGAIGAIDSSKEARRELAGASHEFECPICGKVAGLLASSTDVPASPMPQGEVPSLVQVPAVSPLPSQAKSQFSVIPTTELASASSSTRPAGPIAEEDEQFLQESPASSSIENGEDPVRTPSTVPSVHSRDAVAPAAAANVTLEDANIVGTAPADPIPQPMRARLVVQPARKLPASERAVYDALLFILIPLFAYAMYLRLDLAD